MGAKGVWASTDLSLQLHHSHPLWWGEGQDLCRLTASSDKLRAGWQRGSVGGSRLAGSCNTTCWNSSLGMTLSLLLRFQPSEPGDLLTFFFSYFILSDWFWWHAPKHLNFEKRLALETAILPFLCMQWPKQIYVCAAYNFWTLSFWHRLSQTAYCHTRVKATLPPCKWLLWILQDQWPDMNHEVWTP